VKCRIAQDTRTGKRPYNQDRLGHWRSPEAVLVVVADGMGGHAHGEVAAEVVVGHFGAEFERAAKPRLADPDLFLYRCIARAHALLRRAARERGLGAVPRTTVAACVVQDGRAYWSHVGDSRFYLIRAGKVAARTRDHTRVQQLLDAGEIGEEEAGAHPERNVLSQCLGGPAPPRVEPAAAAVLERGDVLLLCSDGLWGALPQEALAEGLLAGDLDAALPRLVSEAERRAGARCDNISALALSWEEEAQPEAGAEASPPQDPDRDLENAIENIRRALRERGREALDLVLESGDADAESEYLRMTDEDVGREIARIRDALRRRDPPPPTAADGGGADEEYLRVTDEDIEREIARIRAAFRKQAGS